MVFFIFIQILMDILQQTGDTYHAPHFAVSDLGLHRLPISHKKNTLLIRVNSFHKLKVWKK